MCRQKATVSEPPAPRLSPCCSISPLSHPLPLHTTPGCPPSPSGSPMLRCSGCPVLPRASAPLHDGVLHPYPARARQPLTLPLTSCATSLRPSACLQLSSGLPESSILKQPHECETVLGLYFPFFPDVLLGQSHSCLASVPLPCECLGGMPPACPPESSTGVAKTRSLVFPLNWFSRGVPCGKEQHTVHETSGHHPCPFH